jgi:hypothetical protein
VGRDFEYRAPNCLIREHSAYKTYNKTNVTLTHDHFEQTDGDPNRYMVFVDLAS